MFFSTGRCVVGLATIHSSISTCQPLAPLRKQRSYVALPVFTSLSVASMMEMMTISSMTYQHLTATVSPTDHSMSSDKLR